MIFDSLSTMDDSTTRVLLPPAPPDQAPPAMPQRTRRPRSPRPARAVVYRHSASRASFCDRAPVVGDSVPGERASSLLLDLYSWTAAAGRDPDRSQRALRRTEQERWYTTVSMRPNTLAIVLVADQLVRRPLLSPASARYRPPPGSSVRPSHYQLPAWCYAQRPMSWPERSAIVSPQRSLDVRGRPRCPRPPRARVERFRRLRDTSCGCSPSARPGTRPFRRNALVRLGPYRDRLSLDAVSRTTALPIALCSGTGSTTRSAPSSLGTTSGSISWSPGSSASDLPHPRLPFRLTCAVAAPVATLQDEIHSRRTSVFPASARQSSHEKSGSGCCSVRDTASGESEREPLSNDLPIPRRTNSVA